MPSVYEFAADSLDGRKVALSDFSGKVLLIVNTASHCGFTPQYEGLQQLHTSLAPRGFAVLGFPCNQFGKQEPGDAGAIAEFCESNYHVTFPLFVEVDEIYNLACPASPIHYQHDPVQTTKTSVHGAIVLLKATNPWDFGSGLKVSFPKSEFSWSLKS